MMAFSRLTGLYTYVSSKTVVVSKKEKFVFPYIRITVDFHARSV